MALLLLWLWFGLAHRSPGTPLAAWRPSQLAPTKWSAPESLGQAAFLGKSGEAIATCMLTSPDGYVAGCEIEKGHTLDELLTAMAKAEGVQHPTKPTDCKLSLASFPHPLVTEW